MEGLSLDGKLPFSLVGQTRKGAQGKQSFHRVRREPKKWSHLMRDGGPQSQRENLPSVLFTLRTNMHKTDPSQTEQRAEMPPNTGVDSLKLIAYENVNINNLEENNRIHNVQVTMQNYCVYKEPEQM